MEEKRGRRNPRETMLNSLAIRQLGVLVSEMIVYTRDIRLWTGMITIVTWHKKYKTFAHGVTAPVARPTLRGCLSVYLAMNVLNFV